MNPTEIFIKTFPFDLHVLGTPPAFILSQDRTLSLKFVWSSQETLGFFNRYYCLRSFLKISWTCNNSGQRIFCSGFLRNACISKEAWLKIHWMNPISEKTEGFRAWTELLLQGHWPPRSLPYRPLFLEFSGFYVLFSFQCPERRRRDLNPRTVTSDLLPFQGSPFNHLGTSARAWIFWIIQFCDTPKKSVSSVALQEYHIGCLLSRTFQRFF